MYNEEETNGVPPQWLSPEEAAVWLKVWAFNVWLPSRLDSQLKADFGMSHYDYFAMAQISMAPDRTLRMSQLAHVSNMTLSHLSRVITRLENKGWVRRLPDPHDGRSIMVTLSDAGWELLQRAAPCHVAEVRRRVFDGLDEQDVVDLNRVLTKVVARLDAPTLPHV